MTPLLDGSAQGIAAAVQERRGERREVTEAALARIEASDAALGAFTDVTAERALARPLTSTPRARAASASGRSPACPSRSRTCST